MGYYSNAKGSAVFDTPLLDDELIAALNEYDESYLGAFFDISMHGLECRDSDDSKAYYLEEEVRKLFAKHPGRGIIQVQGEENGDIWRLVIDGSDVTRQDVVMSWPDGTPYKSIWGR